MILNRGTHDMHLAGKVKRAHATLAKLRAESYAPSPARIVPPHRVRFVHHAGWNLGERQIAFGICCGMSYAQMAEALGIAVDDVSQRVARLLKKTGMRDRVKFALRQNAAVRELLEGAA